MVLVKNDAVLRSSKQKQSSDGTLDQVLLPFHHSFHRGISIKFFRPSSLHASLLLGLQYITASSDGRHNLAIQCASVLMPSFPRSPPFGSSRIRATARAVPLINVWDKDLPPPPPPTALVLCERRLLDE